MVATTVKTTAKKAAQKVEQVEAKIEEANGKNPVVKAVRSVLLTGLGALVVGKDEIEARVEKLVEKGEVAEKDSRKVINGLLERRRKDVSKAEEKVEGMLDKRIEAILSAMNVPGKQEMEDLSAKISDLAKKVADLDKKLGAEKKAA